jgi:N-acetylated-alpha-linked acidic dipeptidase
MVFTPFLILAIAHSALACQRQLLDRDHPPPHNLPLIPRQAATFPPQWTAEERILHTSFSTTSLDTWSSYYTHGNHIAGLNKSMAEATARQWSANGVPSELVEYEVYLDYPKEQALVLKWGNGSTYEAQLWEDVLAVDGTTGAEGRTGAWHGYSKSGVVEAEYVYVG